MYLWYRIFLFVMLVSCLQEFFHLPYPLKCQYSKNQFYEVDPVCLIYAFTLDLFVNHFNVFSSCFSTLSSKLLFRKILFSILYKCITDVKIKV